MNSAFDTVKVPAKNTPAAARESATNILRHDNVVGAKEESSSTPQQESASSERRPSDDEKIRQRAYDLYAQGGYQDGSADRDWFAAEREIRNETKKKG